MLKIGKKDAKAVVEQGPGKSFDKFKGITSATKEEEDSTTLFIQ